jgi:hypothetical protein
MNIPVSKTIQAYERFSEKPTFCRILQALISSLGICFLVWAFYDSRFRDTEGFFEGAVCLPVTVGVALIILGWALNSRWKKFAFWLALALMGQAVALQLIEAGPYMRYQHYKTLSRLLEETNPLLLLCVVVQTALVLAGLKTRWPKIRAWFSQTLKPWQLFGIGLIFFFSSATVSRKFTIYATELFFASFIQAVNLGNIVLIAWATPEIKLVPLKKIIDKLIGSEENNDIDEPRIIDSFTVMAAFWVTIIAAILCIYSYQRHPHIPDEVVYLYQARHLSEGVLAMPAPPVPEAFDIYLMHFDGKRWYPSPPAGWPAMLALGVLLGIPWLINPILAGLNILLSYLFIQEIYSRYTARMVVLLLCFSPWYIFMAMNFMTHTFTLTCALCAALAIIKARKSGRAIWGWLGGIATGMVSLIRPLEGLIVAGLLGLWSIGIGGRRLKTSAILGLILGSIIVGSFVLPYNKFLTGDPVVFPIMAYTNKHFGPKANSLGFGPDRGMGWPIDPFPGHSPLDALVNANLNTFSINIELFGWSTGSLFLIAFLLFKGNLRRSDFLMIAVIAAVFGAHFFYYFSGGPDFGARYWYLMLVPCIVLTVRGIEVFNHTFGNKVANLNLRSAKVKIGFIILCLMTFVNYFSWRAIDKYHHYLGMRPDIRYISKDYGFGKSLVLIRGNEHSDYASAAAYNPVDLHSDVPIYAWDRNPRLRAQLLAAYSDRSIWIVNGPSITHGAFEVAEVPQSVDK